MLRPSFTWPMTNQDTGATLLYHGHTVLFEWQSRQERSMIAETCGVICVRAKIVCDSSTGGLVRAGRLSCAARNRITIRKRIARSTFNVRRIRALLFEQGLDRGRQR